MPTQPQKGEGKKDMPEWEQIFELNFMGNQRYNLDGCIREEWYLKDDVTYNKIKNFIRNLLSSHTAELKERVEKSDIAKDKVGSFQDGYRCCKQQVLSLLDNK
jgi:hypothetical protein